METTSFRYRQSQKAFRSLAGLLAIAALCATHSAWSQQPNISTNPLHAINTPKQVMTGAAKPLQAYDPASKLRLAISITAPKMAEEEELLKELQDRTSPNFHKWLTPEQWNARFAPSAQDEQAVVDWAASQGLTVTARYPNRLMVDVEGNVETIEKAFGIKINQYQLNGQTEFSNDRDPVIPGHLAGIIQYVDGLNSILRMRPASKSMKGIRGADYTPGPVRQEGPGGQMNANKAAADALKSSESGGQVGSQVTNGFYDPSDIWGSNMYDFNALQAQGHCCNPTNNSGGTPPNTSIALATDGDFLDSDMVGFHNQYPYLAYHYFRHFVDGTPSCCDDETTLDLEWSTATSNSRGAFQDTASIHVYETAKGFGTFGDIFEQMLTDNAVRVVNISYGLDEDYLNGFGLVTSWHGMFNQMIGQGWTVMAAAGDNGVNAGCGSSAGVLYPESDPDLVSVGGTQLALNTNGTFASEVTWTGDTFSGACSENDGGTGGGCSNLFAAPGYQAHPACGSNSRSVPDISLHASPHPYSNFFFEGGLDGVAGTSIASPEVSGFMAQANAYLLAIGLGGSPLGEVNNAIYYQGNNPGGEFAGPHYPFYDTTSGCNSNDVSIADGITPFCAGTGYDLTTGWGSFNALQLSWAINSWWLGAFDPPTVAFSGPFSGANGSDHWYNTDQTVSWTVTSHAVSGLTPTGVAGYTAVWDNYISDPFSEATPGSGNSFYSGPEFPNATSGSLDLASAGQGCHFATVDAWDNAGYTPGEQFYYYVCYDNVAPVPTATLSGTLHGSVYDSGVKVTLSATDATSGVAHIFYSIDGGGFVTYSAPFTLNALGPRSVRYYSTDVAGNASAVKTASFTISSLTTTKVTSSPNPSGYGQKVTLTATVTAALSGTPNGSVQFFSNGSLVGTGTLASGKASVSTSVLPAKSHTIIATYVGNTSFITSTSAGITDVVNKANTSAVVTANVNPSQFNQPVTFTATISSQFGAIPGSGTVTFLKNGSSLGTAPVASNGKATFTTSVLTAQTHNITVAYAGGDNYNPSTSAGLAEVTKAASTTTALTSSPNPSNFAVPVTLTATVTPAFGGTVTGTVTFSHLGTSLGTVTLTGNVAKLVTGNLPVGLSHITATFNGSTNFLTSTSSALSQTVNKAVTVTTVVSSLNPSTHGNSVTFTAHVHANSGATPTGTVTFKDGSTTLGSGTIDGSGNATFSTSALAVGTHSITAAYGGSSTDATSASAVLSQKVN